MKITKITGCSFEIQSNLAMKDGVQSVLLNELLETFWIRPKNKEEAYNEVSDLYMTVKKTNNSIILFHRTIFRRTKNGKRFVWTFVKKDGRTGGYVAKKLIHKFSKPAEKKELPITPPPRREVIDALKRDFDEWEVLDENN